MYGSIAAVYVFCTAVTIIAIQKHSIHSSLLANIRTVATAAATVQLITPTAYRYWLSKGS
jgi:hypothetical protein